MSVLQSAHFGGTKMKIGILGSGRVGQTLATGLLNAGHEVMIGTRDPSKLEAFTQTHPALKVGSNADAAQYGPLIFLATTWQGAQNALELAGADHLTGKVVVDLTNPVDFSTGRPQLALGWNTSAGESVQAWIPQAQVVKALNTSPAEAMLRPREHFGDTADMLMAGNDAQAKGQVKALLESFGWHVVDSGDLSMSRYLEPLGMLWIMRSVETGGQKRDHYFKLMNW